PRRKISEGGAGSLRAHTRANGTPEGTLIALRQIVIEAPTFRSAFSKKRSHTTISSRQSQAQPLSEVHWGFTNAPSPRALTADLAAGGRAGIRPDSVPAY